MERPEVFKEPVMIAGISTYIYKHPKEGHRYISVRMYKERYGNPNRYRNNKKEVHQFLPCGTYIATFDSIVAASRATGITHKRIQPAVARSLSECKRTVGGFYWSSESKKTESIIWEYSNKKTG